LWRYGGGQALEIALLAKAAEVGERIPVAFEKDRIHAVDADDDELSTCGLRGLARASGE
jgi:hypothetical protein